MMFDMDLEEDSRHPAKRSLVAGIQSPIVLPSLTLSRPGSRMAASRSESPAPPVMHRKPSVSAGVLNLIESQLDDARIDSEYEDMAGNEQVEVPIIDDYANEDVTDEDCVDEDSDKPALASRHSSNSTGIIQQYGECAAEVDEDDSAAANAKVATAVGSCIRPKATIDDFDVLKLIGKGGYGMVYLVQHKQTRKHYAMKVLRKASILLQKRQITFTMTERSILSEVQHPFIVKLYYAFQSNSKLYLIMEYVAGGELFTHMSNERIFSEDQAVFYAAELVLALSHLHKLGIVFRDAKPENCLLGKSGHLVLTDFGLSKTALGEDGRTSTFCGTPSYMAPEVLDSVVSYDFSVDWWSLGVLVYEMLTGAVPFKGKSPQQISKNIAKMKINYPPYITPDAKDLVIRLLRKNPSQRLGYGVSGVRDIKKHRFFRKVNWEKLEKHHESYTPPIVPQVSGDADVSNFASEFTSQQLPPSIACECIGDSDAIPNAPALLESAQTDDAGVCDKQCRNGSESKSGAEGDVDPATAFLGFSYVATSVLDTLS